MVDALEAWKILQRHRRLALDMNLQGTAETLSEAQDAMGNGGDVEEAISIIRQYKEAADPLSGIGYVHELLGMAAAKLELLVRDAGAAKEGAS